MQPSRQNDCRQDAVYSASFPRLLEATMSPIENQERETSQWLIHCLIDERPVKRSMDVDAVGLCGSKFETSEAHPLKPPSVSTTLPAKCPRIDHLANAAADP